MKKLCYINGCKNNADTCGHNSKFFSYHECLSCDTKLSHGSPKVCPDCQEKRLKKGKCCVVFVCGQPSKKDQKIIDEWIAECRTRKHKKIKKINLPF